MQPDKDAHVDLSFLFPFEPSILMAETTHTLISKRTNLGNCPLSFLL